MQEIVWMESGTGLKHQCASESPGGIKHTLLGVISRAFACRSEMRPNNLYF